MAINFNPLNGAELARRESQALEEHTRCRTVIIAAISTTIVGLVTTLALHLIFGPLAALAGFGVGALVGAYLGKVICTCLDQNKPEAQDQNVDNLTPAQRVEMNQLIERIIEARQRKDRAMAIKEDCQRRIDWLFQQIQENN